MKAEVVRDESVWKDAGVEAGTSEEDMDERRLPAFEVTIGELEGGWALGGHAKWYRGECYR